jgi:hypothetical protein
VPVAHVRKAIISEGLRFGFRTNRAELISRLPAFLAPGSSAAEFKDLDFVYSLAAKSRPRSYAAYLGSKLMIRTTSLELALTCITSSFHDTLAQYSRQHLFLHAGVIGWRGKAVLFPGPTRSGKSSLIRALIRAGAVYFSDEFAPVDAHGLVHPLPRPLCLRSPAGKITVRPEDEAAQIAAGPLPIAAIVIARYRSAGFWRPAQLSRGHATLELLRNTIAVRLNPIKALQHASFIASTSVAIRSYRGEADTAAPAVLQTVDNLMN